MLDDCAEGLLYELFRMKWNTYGRFVWLFQLACNCAFLSLLLGLSFSVKIHSQDVETDHYVLNACTLLSMAPLVLFEGCSLHCWW